MIMKEYLNEKNLGQMLEYLYPDSIWIHNETIPGDITEMRSNINKLKNFKRRRFRPDYRNEKDSIIVEFDGITHYQSSVAYWNDIERKIYYNELGYELIQIPYFVQPTKEILKLYFGIDIDSDLTEKLNGFNVINNKSNRNLPSSFSEDGIRRFINEFKEFDDIVQNEIMSTLYQNYVIEGISLKILPLSLMKFLNFQVTDKDKEYNESFVLDKYFNK